MPPATEEAETENIVTSGTQNSVTRDSVTRSSVSGDAATELVSRVTRLESVTEEEESEQIVTPAATRAAHMTGEHSSFSPTPSTPFPPFTSTSYTQETFNIHTNRYMIDDCRKYFSCGSVGDNNSIKKTKYLN